MATFLFGLVLLAFPLISLSLFTDKKRGFVYILFFSILFQIALTLLTQSLGIFYYWVICGATTLIDILVVFVCLDIIEKKKKTFSFDIKKVDWLAIIVVIISIITLYCVHYDYTGEISSSTDGALVYHQVNNMTYPYPYFSDEWYAVSLVQGAISNHSLPIKNILNNTGFLNLEIFFHSFIAELVLLLGLNPLLQYTALSIFLNTIIILLMYLFLRINTVPRLASAVSSLSALYIVSGGNLPGLWHLIPFTLGIVFFLLTFCFAEFGDVWLVVSCAILGSLFYPPMMPFYTLAVLIFLFIKNKISKEKFKKFITAGFLAFFGLFILACIIILTSFSNIVSYIFSRVFFASLTAPFLLQVNLYDIMPLPVIIVAVLGLCIIYKNKKWLLLSELVLGCIFWFFYSFTVNRFFIDYERIAILVAVMVTVISGFGLAWAETYTKAKFSPGWYKALRIAEIILLSAFLIFLPFYTARDNWKKIISVDYARGMTAYPKSPANNYLTPDDLAIFKTIKNKSFLSIPWKGTVIGVATGNHPILVKEGNISIGSQKTLNDFLAADCQGKENIAKKFKLDYIYLYQINCPQFKEIGKSGEGFILYKTNLD